jgi:nitronate monooxygenase
VTDRDEARHAQAAGADALVGQGTEAGGHRGGFADRDDAGAAGSGLLALLRVVAHTVPLPLVATGGIADGAAVAAVLCAGASAPVAYPEIHHVTSPLRAAARTQGDADAFNLWAGQAHELAQARPAGEIVRQMGADARRALRETAERLSPGP